MHQDSLLNSCLFSLNFIFILKLAFVVCLCVVVFVTFISLMYLTLIKNYCIQYAKDGCPILLA